MSGECGNRFQVLCYEQVSRLAEVTDAPIEVHGRGNFPTLEIQLKDLVKVINAQLKQDGILVKDIRLNGGAASYILGCHTESSFKFNDLDLIFRLDMSSHNDLQKVKTAVLNSLLNFLPEGVNKEKMSSCSLKEAYVHKMVKVCNDNDRWSLISLFSNNKGKNVDLKFVDTMKRQFEFSVDSFQIILDSLLTFYDISPRRMSEHFYPTVVAESVFGHFNTALYHLNNKLIATRNPEQIRGGGLLKYCNLLVRDYVPAENVDIKSLERYMCSRFFIDFPDTSQQQVKLENYLASHFTDDDQMKYEYLMTLYTVVDESTICLMGHERRQTLNLIQQHASQVQLEQNQKAYNKQLQMQQFDKQNFSSSSPVYDQQSNLIIDQVYYGPYSYQIAPMGGEQYYPTYTYVTPADSTNGQCPYCPKYLQCS